MKKTKTLNSPKILILDIETKPLESYTWGIWDQNVPLNMIKSDWSIMSFAAKWLGDAPNKTIYMDQRNKKDISNDKELCQGIWKLMDEADILVTQNGKSFDVKKLNARFVMHGLPPPSSYRHLDTKRIASRNFAFTSNKLEYMTEKLNKKYKKLKHGKYPGFSLWKECMDGNKDAWNEMKKYNIHDVLATEELYRNLAAWDTTINFSVFDDGSKHTCACGHKEFENKGYAYTSTGKFQRYKCKKCGRESRSKINLLSVEKRKALKA